MTTAQVAPNLDQDIDEKTRSTPPANPEPEPVKQSSSWEPVDLAPVLAGEVEEEQPVLLERSDGMKLIYSGRVNALIGEPESLKSLVAQETTRQVLDSGGRVVYLDFEDNTQAIVARLRALGVTDLQILEQFTYIRPVDPVGKTNREFFDNLFTMTADLFVIDGITEAMVLFGFDLISNTDIAEFNAKLPRPLADTGAAVLMIDHVTKSKDGRGRYAIGAQHKLAGLDGASYTLETVEPFGRGRIGSARMKLGKDRLGWVRGQTINKDDIAVVVATSYLDGGISIKLNPPASFAAWKPTYYMEQVSKLIEAEPGINVRTIREQVGGRASYVDQAIGALITDKYVTVETGTRNAKLHYSNIPYRQPEDDLND